MEKNMDKPHSDLGDPDAAATAQAADKVVAPPITGPGQKLTEEERLGIENLYLKMQNLQLQMQQLDATKAAIVEQIRDLNTELVNRRAVLSKKYGVDIGRNTVAPDGTIRAQATVPAPPGQNGG